MTTRIEVSEARRILDALVGFPTVSRDSNLDLIDWVKEYLGALGVTSRRVYDETGKKAALYANVGPEVEGGIVLSGHTDVVPIDGQDWTTDPFEVVEKDGKLYGRGTSDMKGFDALALAAVPKALEQGVKRPLQIALSYDEEVGLIGAPPMIDDMRQHLPKAALAIIGEPTRMACVTGHKGGAGYDIHMHGYEVHSSLLHQGVSAIMEGARLIQWANDRNDENRAAEPTPMAALFEPPWTTLHVGQIHGGTAHNITAKDCRFVLSFRCVPGDDPAAWETRLLDEVARLDAAMKQVRPGAGITATRIFDAPLLEPEEDGAAEAFVRRITGDNGTHVVSYGTEAGHFQHRGYSAVVCGPGDIAQAHQPDEFIEISELEKGAAFLDKVIETLTHD